MLFFTALVSAGASLRAALGALDGSPTPVGAAVTAPNATRKTARASVLSGAMDTTGSITPTIRATVQYAFTYGILPLLWHYSTRVL